MHGFAPFDHFVFQMGDDEELGILLKFVLK
jgi:hypothetical protein